MVSIGFVMILFLYEIITTGMDGHIAEIVSPQNLIPFEHLNFLCHHLWLCFFHFPGDLFRVFCHAQLSQSREAISSSKGKERLVKIY